MKTYQDTLSANSSIIINQEKIQNRLFWVRIFFALLAIYSIYETVERGSIYWKVIIFVSLIMFFIIVSLMQNISKKIAYLKNICSVCEHELLAKNGDLSNFYDGEKYIDKTHQFSYDLDLFGTNSIFQLLNRTFTLGGSDKLAFQLNNPIVEIPKLLERQSAIKELKIKIDWRVSFLAIGINLKNNIDVYPSLIKWLSSKTTISTKFPQIALFFIPAIHLCCLFFDYRIWLVFIFCQMVFTAFYKTLMNESYREVSTYAPVLKHFADLFKVVENENFESVILKTLRQNISFAEKKMRDLSKITQDFQVRNFPASHFLFNLFFPWDFWCSLRFEAWKKQSSENILQAVDSLNDLEILNSIGFYAHISEKQSFPTFSDTNILHAKNIGHPLIFAKKRVYNDFSIDENGRIYIVTGANMAGKSTFLRTVGVNFVLGMMGSPICGESFEFKPLMLVSCMRVSDSIQTGTSYFQSELLRLKMIIDLLEQGQEMFILLDELLKGTNSADKLKGSELFLDKLLSYKTVYGLLATHDLELTKKAEQYPEQIKNICFEIGIKNEKMIFDYQVKNGVTNSMNAQFLMKKIGII